MTGWIQWPRTLPRSRNPRASCRDEDSGRTTCGTPVTHLPLLPSGPDGVHRFRAAQGPAFNASARDDPGSQALRREFDPAIADCGYRAPLAPRLARPRRLYRARCAPPPCLRAGLLGRGQADTEGRAAPRSAVDFNLAIVQLHQLLYQGQPQAGPAVAAGGGVINLGKELEDATLGLGIDGHAPVNHLEGDDPVLARSADLHLGLVGAELDGVVHQRLENLAEALEVGLRAEPLGHPDGDLHAMAFDQGCEVLEGGHRRRPNQRRGQVEAQPV